MHRRPLGGGRTLALVGGILIVAGCVLPWWTLGGETGIPAVSGNAFEGSGIIVFLSGVLTLALVALPYAVGDRPTGLDRWVSFAILAIAGWIGLAWRVVDLLLTADGPPGAFHFTEPVQVFTNGPGLWIAGLGLAVVSRAVYLMTREPAYR
jgi:hypothetical protein